MKKETKIDEICRKENKVQLTKEWLRILFFVTAAIVAIIYCKALSTPIIDHGETAAITITVTLSAFAALLISGYFYNGFLSKKLDRLWEQKKLLF
ncbi:TPA: hypothetical protein DCZ15_04105 [Candidatus Falkowbacteria bacterium]|nr:MAG: hypothetical protein UV95_C0001G0350 [Candidatus Falkowbacteria bacterium GW2011_GWF2_43_32]HBA37023.1 hypothetical protein [Candidatus Falkowbacteria bacterium]